MTDRAYPIQPALEDDPRFNIGLTVDVIKVLEEHGYPPIKNGLDIVALQQALFRFLYEDGAS
ncbi:hypothetical protein ACFVIY_18000 [Streptomyces sp. NPDC127166]|uniref:hypothetical protein n=1 Tax=Streptomyces sp. NPDC127166 TaxID=3345380 RepID=UPI003634B0ED